MKQDINTDWQAMESIERAKLISETAKIKWQELEICFARGAVVYVSSHLDLVDVAYAISIDDLKKVEQWIKNGSVLRQFDDLAAVWAEEDATVLCVVVRPWVLVQPLADMRVLN